MPRLAGLRGKPNRDDVDDAENPRDRYPGAVLEPHEFLPVVVAATHHVQRCVLPRNAELLSHATKSRIATQILERRLHDIVAKRPILDGLVEPRERLVELTKARVRHRHTVRANVAAVPFGDQRISNLA